MSGNFSDWSPYTNYVQAGLVDGTYANAGYTMLAAGPPRLANIGGSAATVTDDVSRLADQTRLRALRMNRKVLSHLKPVYHGEHGGHGDSKKGCTGFPVCPVLPVVQLHLLVHWIAATSGQSCHTGTQPCGSSGRRPISI